MGLVQRKKGFDSRKGKCNKVGEEGGGRRGQPLAVIVSVVRILP